MLVPTGARLSVARMSVPWEQQELAGRYGRHLEHRDHDAKGQRAGDDRQQVETRQRTGDALGAVEKPGDEADHGPGVQGQQPALPFPEETQPAGQQAEAEIADGSHQHPQAPLGGQAHDHQIEDDDRDQQPFDLIQAGRESPNLDALRIPLQGG